MFKIFLFTILLISLSFGHGMSDAEKQIIVDGGNLHYIYIGAVHMLWGFDHLLFVLGIIFFLQTFKDIVKYITAFTIGHSITLILATFNAIAINYYIIDAIIALSVCLIGVINLGLLKKYVDFTSNKMLTLIFGLGLIHGLGLSTRLQQLPLNQDNLLLNIISFNIGIELGQIAALAVMLILINTLRKSKNFKIVSTIINSLIVMAGIYFFIYQVVEYKNNVNSGRDTITIVIPAKGEKEYKLWLETDNKLQYSWSTNPKTSIYFDFHGEPAADTTGYFKSYKESTKSEDKGELVASFIGTHGWYWKNESSNNITINLNINGTYKRMDNYK